VDTNYRKRGIGGRLLNFIKESAKKRGKKFLRLYTDPKDEKEAQLFYEKIGLKEVNAMKSIYHKDSFIYREMRL
jgi:ribosomal protein S18 acetylase RimI-like enzyme